MPRTATVIAAVGLGMVTLAAAMSLPGSAPSSAISAWELGETSSSASQPAPVTSRATSADTPTKAVGASSVSTAPSTRSTVPTSAVTGDPTATETPERTVAPPDTPWAGPDIAPSAATSLRIPSIAVEASVVPVDSTPTGELNPWGGEIYSAIDFPVDAKVRQWIRRGDPNSVAGESADPKQFDRVVLYGHASDIGNHLVFQDLSAMHPGDDIVVTTALGTFTYRADRVLTQAKANLDALPELYDYPTGGAKEIALVACLPDSSSNVVVLGSLVAAETADMPVSTDGVSHSLTG